jgi:hypothetical protein
MARLCTNPVQPPLASAAQMHSFGAEPLLVLNDLPYPATIKGAVARLRGAQRLCVDTQQSLARKSALEH